MVQQKDDDNKKTVEEEFIRVTDFPVSFAIFGLARSHRALAVPRARNLAYAIVAPRPPITEQSVPNLASRPLNCR